MEEVRLDVQIRSEKGSRKIKNLRRNEYIPGVVYGGGRHGPTVIKVEERMFERVMRQHQGQSIVFHINVMEGDQKLRDYSAILKEEQYDPLSDRRIHVDFQRISLKKEVEVSAPVRLVGEAVGVAKEGGSLDQHLREIHIVCLPTKIPEHVDVDISNLSIGQSFHISDIVLPEGVKAKHEAETVVVTVVPPMRDVEETEPSGETEPEVIKEKKKDVAKDESGTEETSPEKS